MKSVARKQDPQIDDLFKNSQLEQDTRVEYKYGITRGVYGTPFMAVNGVI